MLVLLTFILNLDVFANNKEVPKNSYYKNFSCTYITGGQVYNDNFLYNPGFAFDFSTGKPLNKEVSLGLGTGYLSLTNENFVPVYMEIMGDKKKKKNTPFIRFKAGYSFGWNDLETTSKAYEMQGGLYFSAGLGRRIEIMDNLCLLFNWSYCHQSSRLDYQIFGERKYYEAINFEMFQISVSLLIK